MFYVEGLVPLCDVAWAVRSRLRIERIQLMRAREESGESVDWAALEDGLASQANEEIWLICRQAKRVAVLLGNGRVVDASRELVDGSSDEGSSNDHLDLFNGNIGSSAYWNFVRTRDGDAQQLRLREVYGPFFHLPVLLNSNCLERAKHGPMPEEEAAENANSSSRSEAAVAREIVKLYDQDVRPRKQEFKELVAPDMGPKAFQRAWAQARDSRPDLGKAGPKPRRS